MTARLGRHVSFVRLPAASGRRPRAAFVVLASLAALALVGESGCRILPCPEGQVCGNQPATSGAGGAGVPVNNAGSGDTAGAGSGNTGNTTENGGSGGRDPEEEAGAAAIWEDVTPKAVELDPSAFGNFNYGILQVAVAPDDPTTVYFTTSYQGLWKSTNSGDTWKKINTGVNSDKIDQGRGGTFIIDPVEPNVMYLSSGYGALGIWKSINGGVDWDPLFTDDAKHNPTRPINPSGDFNPDIATFDLDPADHLHLVAAFHDVPWKGYADAGFVETLDGGLTWKLVPPTAGMGNGQCIYFLNDSATWLSESNNPSSGIWRTTNSGKTFKRVADSSNHYGACQIYRGDKVFYIGTGSGVYRSSDNGATWAEVSHLGAIQGIVGDGTHLWASGPYAPSNLYNPTQRTLESPGNVGWHLYGDQQFRYSANSLAVDIEHNILYAAAWNAGVLRLVTQ